VSRRSFYFFLNFYFSPDALRGKPWPCDVERVGAIGIQLARLQLFRYFAAHPRFIHRRSDPMNAFPNTRDAIGDSWNSTSRRARRISRHSREAAQDIGSELRTLISEIEDTLSEGTSADVAALRAQLSKSVDSARARLNDTHDAVRARANTALADADTYIHDKPWQTIALVGGLALVAGVLLARIR
jgi:ElaB/YqjD/DUF883 family membrane-anchored ribosome-binding protein